MFTVAGIGFLAPWLLVGLLALPVLWLLLRAVPPAPLRRLFPGVVLLLGLEDEDRQSDKTPWWLLLLRMLAMAAVIIGFAGPVLNPQPKQEGSGALLVLLDGTWADARDWAARMRRVSVALEQAQQAGRMVSVVALTDLPPEAPVFQAAQSWQTRIAGVQPRPWEPEAGAVAAWAGKLEGAFDTLWLSDGLRREGRQELLALLKQHGAVQIFQGARPVMGLRPAQFDGGAVSLEVLRAGAGPAQETTILARGLDPAGVDRVLAQGTAHFDAGASQAELRLSLPAELRNRLSRFTIADTRSAGAVSLVDDSLKRREIAIVSPHASREGVLLLQPTHYIKKALAPSADLIEGTIGDILPANPDVIVLADIARLAPAEAEGITEWVKSGGMLLRFAGPRLAASPVSRGREDPLMPVRLRAGGRTIGGAMSWGEPKKLRDFERGSPFFGLSIPDDVRVNAQVLAEPDPQLSARVIATLADGTPLVTRKKIGLGQVVLFHVTANAEWSSLPLSGLFVQMLERLAVSSAMQRPEKQQLAGTTWMPVKVLDGFGAMKDAGNLSGIAGERLAEGRVGQDLPPGVYEGESRRIAVNVIGPKTVLAPAAWPAGTPIEGFAVVRETALKAVFLTFALVLLALDLLASLWLSGRLKGPRPGAMTGAAILALAMVSLAAPQRSHAQSDAFALEATSQTVLAYVITGDAQVDRVSEAGLRGLSDILFARTSVEPANPMAVNPETDEIAFFPFLYWPVAADAPLPSPQAYAKLNRYLRNGGMILFDTRDADVSGSGVSSAAGRRLEMLASPLDIPPLEIIPEDHVLTRAFYLINTYPGRYDSPRVWVEAAPPDARQVEGMPFRNLNDNVTPVVIGGNDWAAAWAVDDGGNYMFPVGRGRAGERQRELAYRFGVNLIMYVLTGNYKSDQVHVPALLERLGQ